MTQIDIAFIAENQFELKIKSLSDVGFWASTDELCKQWQQSRRWNSTSTSEQRSVGYAGWKKAVERTLNWVD